MLNKFLKTFFFVSIIIAALVAFFATANFSEDWFANILVTSTYGSHSEISTAVVAFFPIATTILSALLTLIISTSIYFIQKKKSTATNSKKSKFFLFYFTSLVIVSLLVLLSCVIRFNISERFIWSEDVVVVALLYAGCILEALILAAFLVSFFTLWKTNKLAATIIGVLILLAIPANIISGIAVYEVSDYSYNQPYYTNSYNNYDSYDSAVELQELPDNNDYETIEVEEDYLSFLWDDEDDVASAFAYLFQEKLESWNGNDPVDFLRFDISYTTWLTVDDDDWNESSNPSENTLHKIFAYLVQNPSEILNSFYSYQNVIYEYIPVYEFYGTSASSILSYLTAAHEDLYSDSDLSRLKKIYKLMTNIEHDWASEYYDDIKLHVKEEYLPTFYWGDNYFHSSGVVWAYSFWARRNAEGIDDIAYTILTQLNDYYSDAEYYYSGDEYGEEEESDEDYYYEDEESD